MASKNVKFDITDDDSEDNQYFDEIVINNQSTASSKSAYSTSGQSQPNLATSTPTWSDGAQSDHLSVNPSTDPSGHAQGNAFGASSSTRAGPESFDFENFSWQWPGNRGCGDRGESGNPSGRGRGRGNPPPFQPNNNDEADKYEFFNLMARAFKDGLRSEPEVKPNYRGIEKPKISFFDGNASQYAHWKSTFHLIYTEDRNLPESYLATALFGLLKGEAKRAVQIHITTEWNGDNYKQMWKQLDLRYGTKHIQARCIRDEANRIPYLDVITLKTVLAFYEEVTVQINHYLIEQPHAVHDENSLLFQFFKDKMSNKVVDKYIDYLDSDAHRTPLKRTPLTLQQ
jgi:hypothetical protein